MSALSAESQYLAIAGTSAKFANAMEPGRLYQFAPTSDCWIRITSTSGAAEVDTANNILVLSGQRVLLVNPDVNGTTNAYVHVIRDTADGKSTLSPLGAPS